ncbi:MAG: DUF4166 domain-containing protein [Alteraurantiacibacter sp.]
MRVRSREIETAGAMSLRSGGGLADMRFRRLMGGPEWRRLPANVRKRFAKRMAPGVACTYRGRIEHCRMSRAGWWLAQACRLIGAPLPLDTAPDMAAVVSVTEDRVGSGQVWSRLYARPGGFPQVIHSAKRFAGPTGLEEHLGLGFGMALRLEPLPHGIRFVSDHFFLKALGKRFRLPRWLAPGLLHIDHRDLGEGRFRFVLSLVHPLFGELVRQSSIFADQADREGDRK